MKQNKQQTEQPAKKVHEVKAFIGGVIKGEIVFSLFTAINPAKSFVFVVPADKADDFRRMTDFPIDLDELQAALSNWDALEGQN